MTDWVPWMAVAAFVGLLVLLPLLAWVLIQVRRAQTTARDALARAGKLDTQLNSVHRIMDGAAGAQHRTPDALRDAIQILQDRVERLEGPAQPSPARSASPRPGVPRMSQPGAHAPARQPDPLDVGQLTAQAATALLSPDSFKTFAATAGGSGLVLRKDNTGTDPAPSPDAADLWQVPHCGAFLVFPGVALARKQPLLLSDAGRAAEERLGWLFDIQGGDQFKAATPAKLTGDGTVLERGVLLLPR